MKAIDYYKMYVREVENPNGDLIKLGGGGAQMKVRSKDGYLWQLKRG